MRERYYPKGAVVAWVRENPTATWRDLGSEFPKYSPSACKKLIKAARDDLGIAPGSKSIILSRVKAWVKENPKAYSGDCVKAFPELSLNYARDLFHRARKELGLPKLVAKPGPCIAKAKGRPGTPSTAYAVANRKPGDDALAVAARFNLPRTAIPKIEKLLKAEK